jgi:Arc/MetJ family transcription regulator
MKTTVHISDALLAEAQAIAAREKTTLKALVNEGLQRVVKERGEAKPFKLKDASVGGQGLNPELEGASWETIRDLAYEGRGG